MSDESRDSRQGNDTKRVAAATLYSNLMDPSIFHSSAFGSDMQSPSRKRPQVNAQHSCSIDELPDECLIEILQRLDSVKEKSLSAGVSKRWLSLLITINPSGNVYYNPEWEANYDFHERSLVSQNATDVRLVAIAVAGMGRLRRLSIEGNHPTRGVTDVGLSTVGSGCSSLSHLSLVYVPTVTDVGLIHIAVGCRMLETLELRYCPLISDKALIVVAEMCPNLLWLTIEACRGIVNKGLEAIGHGCKKLNLISITNCPLVGDSGVSGLVKNASRLTQIRLHNLNITNLSLTAIGQYGRSVDLLVLTELHNVPERGFSAMGHALGLLKLRNLIIKSCIGITDASLQHIAEGCPSLNTLSLFNCCYLSDAGLKAFFESACNLEDLHLEECCRITLVGVLVSLVNCDTKLDTLTLVNCQGIRDIYLDSAQLPVCASLENLTIRGCPGLTSWSLAYIGMIFPNLEELEMIRLINITDAAVLPLIQNSQLRLLKVSLSDCVNLTDEVVSALVRMHGKTLQRLVLDGCSNITNNSIMEISKCYFSLEDLDLSKCRIDNYGVRVLASARQFNLVMLALAGCLVTDESLPFLCSMGKELRELNIQSCQISTYGINFLDLNLRGCEITS